MASVDVQTATATEAGPAVRKIGYSDLRDALTKGIADFRAAPTHVLFLSVIYPVIGLLLFRATFRYELLPLLFPLAAGFALVGPFAAIGLYEISRAREQGRSVTWRTAFEVLKSPRLGPILVLGGVLMGLFVAWLGAAHIVYTTVMGTEAPKSLYDLAGTILGTAAGSKVLVIGNLIGFAFALAAFSISVVAFPLMLDRPVGAATAAVTSVRAVLQNPLVMAQWGLMVAIVLAIAALPLLVGLSIAMPVLGHATWHLYRRLVV